MKNNVVKIDFSALEKKDIVSYDPKTKTFTIDGDIFLKFTGNLYLNSDKHVIINSGKGLDPNREDGVPFSVWFNSELDDNNQPIVQKVEKKKQWVPYKDRKPCLHTKGWKLKCKSCSGCGH